MVARSAKPGQFVIVRASEKGERIPLTIADYDPERGTVVIVTQQLGVSTQKICALQAGDSLESFAGPLGRPADFVHEDLDELSKRSILFIAGLLGAAGGAVLSYHNFSHVRVRVAIWLNPWATIDESGYQIVRVCLHGRVLTRIQPTLK